MMIWHAHGSRAPRLRQQAMQAANIHRGGSVIKLLPALAKLPVLFRRHLLLQLWEDGICIGHDHLGGLVNLIGDATVLHVVCF